jgi:hypothetical protein
LARTSRRREPSGSEAERGFASSIATGAVRQPVDDFEVLDGFGLELVPVGAVVPEMLFEGEAMRA